MSLALVVVLNLLFFLQKGSSVPLEFEDEMQNITVNLRLDIPKNYLHGNVRLEFGFGKQCAPEENIKPTVENICSKELFEKGRPDENCVVRPVEIRTNLSSYTDCSDLPDTDPAKSGIYNITIMDAVVPVNCQIMQDGRKFLVGELKIFQRRQDGSVDFFRNWNDYTYGFGDINGEFWLGNLNLHYLTSKSNYLLRIEMESFNGTVAYAEYEHFKVGSHSLGFPITVSGYSGTAGDSLSLHSGAKFSTEDADNDSDSKENCASLYGGGWWFTSCYYANLNGIYQIGNLDTGKGINWFHFMGYRNSMKSTKMMIMKN